MTEIRLLETQVGSELFVDVELSVSGQKMTVLRSEVFGNPLVKS